MESNSIKLIKKYDRDFSQNQVYSRKITNSKRYKIICTKTNKTIKSRINNCFEKEEKKVYIRNNKHKPKKSNVFWSNQNYLMIIFFLLFNNQINEFISDMAYFHSSIITIKINKSGIQNMLY